MIECRYEYLWCDKEQYRKPTKLPAPQYMARLMEWVEAQVNDEALFPSAPGTPFPRHYAATVRKSLSRLFRVFVHVYIHHFDHLRDIGAVRCVSFTCTLLSARECIHKSHVTCHTERLPRVLFLLLWNCSIAGIIVTGHSALWELICSRAVVWTRHLSTFNFILFPRTVLTYILLHTVHSYSAFV